MAPNFQRFQKRVFSKMTRNCKATDYSFFPGICKWFSGFHTFHTRTEELPNISLILVILKRRQDHWTISRRNILTMKNKTICLIYANQSQYIKNCTSSHAHKFLKNQDLYCYNWCGYLLGASLKNFKSMLSQQEHKLNPYSIFVLVKLL